jgi:hypothetical protein
VSKRVWNKQGEFITAFGNMMVVRNCGKSSFSGEVGVKTTLRRKWEVRKHRTNLSEFRSTGGQRNEAVSGEKHEATEGGGFVWVLRAEVSLCAVGNNDIEEENSEIGGVGQQQGNSLQELRVEELAIQYRRRQVRTVCAAAGQEGWSGYSEM